MATRNLSKAIQDLCRSTLYLDGTDLTDGDLLENFIVQRDQAAFACLVRRHGPVVWGVCRRVIGHQHDAEDAFQATFLVLARKAASIRKRELLAGWLYGVAHRTALKAKTTTAKRRLREKQMSDMPEQEIRQQDAWCAVEPVIDQELAGLPDKYRLAIVLCDLEGKTCKEAARQLKIPEGTQASRLRTARMMLAKRLARHGLMLPAGVLAATLAQNAASAHAPVKVVSATIAAGPLFAVGGTMATGVISAKVAVLADGVLKAILLAKLKTMVVLALGMIAFGGLLTHLESALFLPVKQDDPPVNLTTKKKADQPDAKDLAKTAPDVQAVDVLGDPLPPGAVARIGTDRFRHQGEASSVTFSPDGKLLAATSRTGQIHLWDSTTGKEVRRLTASGQNGSSRRVLAIDFSPDGKRLASRWSDGTVRMFEVATGDPIAEIPLDEIKMGQGQVCYTPDGKSLLVDLRYLDADTRRLESKIAFIDAVTGKETGKLHDHRGQPGPLVLCHNGKFFATRSGGNLRNVEVWNTATWRRMGIFPEHEFVRALTMSANGEMLASADKDQIVLSHVTSRTSLGVLKAPMGFVIGLAFTPDEKTLISAGHDGKVVFWDLAAKKVRFQRGEQGLIIRSMALSRDGKTLAVGTAYSTIRLWDVASGREWSATAEEPDASINSIAFSPDGKQLATGGDNRHICLWDMPSGRPRLRFDSPNSAQSLAYSPDGKLLATVWTNSQVARLWDVATGQIISELKYDGLGARGVAFSPDGELLVTAHSNLWHGEIGSTSLNIWGTKDGKHLNKHSLQTASLEAIAYAPDGKTLAIATGNGVVLLWDIWMGRVITRLTGHKHSVNSVAFSPDGKVLASGSLDQTVILWDPTSGKKVMSLQDHQRAVTSIAFSPDGRMLISADGDPRVPLHAESPPRIHLWEVATGMAITHLQGHNCDVRALAFSPEGNRIASALGNATVLLWDLGALLRTPGRKVNSLTAQDVDRLWNDLGGADAHKAYQAVWALAAQPDKSVPLLRDRLKPTKRTDLGTIQRWITDLDSGQFAVRQSAEGELAKLGGQVELPIQRALRGKISLETRLRLEQVLKSVRGVHRPSTIRHARAIMVLEMVASPEAKRILEVLAQGAAEGQETHEAKASLERLAKRAINTP